MTRICSHTCTRCSWYSVGAFGPEINQRGEHLNPEGGACSGPILCTPTQIVVRAAKPAKLSGVDGSRTWWRKLLTRHRRAARVFKLVARD